MIYEVKVYDSKGKLKEIISPEILMRKYTKDYYGMTPRGIKTWNRMKGDKPKENVKA